ncbi:hypothetical protein [Clostridium saccharoperbutylacetonicum]|uniref:hypothetical protein n=1 Tax=Clostridium saccharoperbutylacetonicum TaxID=36745 RepID=UPI0039EBB981
MINVDYINELKHYYTILGEEENNKGELFFICAKRDNGYYTMITLRNSEHGHPFPKMNLITENDVNDINKKVIKIADIQTPEKSIGNGSILMKYLFEYVNQNTTIKRIIGTISEVDQGHFDRLEHFYKKHGFKVTFHTNDKGERIAGYIEKDL